MPEDDLKPPWRKTLNQENEPTPRSPLALSVQLKEKRDAAILEKHKEGMSGRKIAELFKMGQRTVADIIAAVSENADSVKPLTPEVSTSAVPMASTEDRADTREDARSFIGASLRKMALGQISKSDQRTT